MVYASKAAWVAVLLSTCTVFYLESKFAKIFRGGEYVMYVCEEGGGVIKLRLNVKIHVHIRSVS